MSSEIDPLVKSFVDRMFAGRKGHGGGPCMRRVLYREDLEVILQAVFDMGRQQKGKYTMTEKQQAFVAQVREVCQRNYEAGGDVVMECMTDAEIVKEFKTIKDVKEYCEMQVEQEQNARWGEDSDPELQRAKWQD